MRDAESIKVGEEFVNVGEVLSVHVGSKPRLEPHRVSEEDVPSLEDHPPPRDQELERRGELILPHVEPLAVERAVESEEPRGSALRADSQEEPEPLSVRAESLKVGVIDEPA